MPPRTSARSNADARKVKQILYNLLSNAVKFTSEGGQVTAARRRVARAAVGQLSGSWKGWSLPLADNGFAEFLKISITIAASASRPRDWSACSSRSARSTAGLSRKFEAPGWAGDGQAARRAAWRRGGGGERHRRGLLLYGLAAAPGEPRGGAGAGQGTAGHRSPRATCGATARTALVVEDDFKSAELIRVQLEAEGFKVLHADSAEAALVLAIQQPLSLITLDIMLPNMDGWEFLGRSSRCRSCAASRS
jgi:CheY-like chemotaxis protein